MKFANNWKEFYNWLKDGSGSCDVSILVEKGDTVIFEWCPEPESKIEYHYFGIVNIKDTKMYCVSRYSNRKWIHDFNKEDTVDYWSKIDISYEEMNVDMKEIQKLEVIESL